MSLLVVKDLELRYPVDTSSLFSRPASVQAVRGVSFEIAAGETLGVVGESGCGKSSIARTLVRLNEASQGSIRFRGQDVAKLRGPELKSYRRSVQMVFQDPFGSLNPKLTVGASIAEGMEVHGIHSDRAVIRREVAGLLERVGLSGEAADRYPREFSGGQRQRIGIARALAVQPELIVCDEPVSALDVSVQAQIVNLLQTLQVQTQISYLFITHDLAVVEHLSHRILVMYLGKIVEEGPAREVVARPRHPYTQALVSAVPGNRRRHGGEVPTVLNGEVPSPLAPPIGCAFHQRCPIAETRCRERDPRLKDLGDGRRVACHLVGDAEKESGTK